MASNKILRLKHGGYVVEKPSKKVKCPDCGCNHFVLVEGIYRCYDCDWIVVEEKKGD